jgi:hypothetical protein
MWVSMGLDSSEMANDVSTIVNWSALGSPPTYMNGLCRFGIGWW